MKRIIQFLLVIIFSSLLFIGCKKDDVAKYFYEFEGENDSWSASYVEKEEDAFTEQEKDTFTEQEHKLADATYFAHTFTLQYKGDLSDLKNVKHMEIHFSTGKSSGSQVADYDEDGGPTSKTFTLMGGTNSSSSFDQDDVIQVEVHRDGSIESFELTLVNGKQGD